MFTKALLALLLTSAAASGSYEAGTATDKVVALEKGNFRAAIEDPANSFWLLKFFAPWWVESLMLSVGSVCTCG